MLELPLTLLLVEVDALVVGVADWVGLMLIEVETLTLAEEVALRLKLSLEDRDELGDGVLVLVTLDETEPYPQTPVVILH